MKRRKPAIPEGAPEGTVWFGGPIEWFKITLQITGEDLVPDEITRLLQCVPDAAEEKGKPIFRQDGTVMRIARHGAWRLVLKPHETDEWDCGEAMLEVLGRVPADICTWRSISSRYHIDFFIGLTMNAKNKGFSLTPKVMSCLVERGIEAGFDIYHEALNGI